jgi:SAM-dependent methyltransferase
VSVQHRVYPETAFFGFSRIDGTVWFYTRVRSLLRPESTMLDIGCGRGSKAGDPVPFRRSLTNMRGSCARVIGIDVSRDGEENALIDEFRVIDDEQRWPLEDGSIDVALTDWVLEHIEDVDSFFREAARVIKPNGSLCIRTVNRHGYPAFCSRMLTDRLRARVLKAAQRDRECADVFPAHYLCNTERKITRYMTKFGFDSIVVPFEAEPAYLDFSPLAYRVAAAVGQYLPGSLKSALLAFGRRRA